MRLFFEHTRHAPCVVLIDEIDGFGDRARYAVENGDYATQVCNALLEHLDGSAGREGLVVIGATNHSERLDPAIVRSGRLVRHVRIALPGRRDLGAMLALHHDEAIPASGHPALAARVGGMTGADVEGIVWTARRAGRPVTRGDLDAVLGTADASITPGARQCVAVHEDGHALAAWTGGIIEVRGISLDAEGRSAWVAPRDAPGLATLGGLLGHLVVLLPRRAAEEVVLGEISAGAQLDLAAATRLAVAMETLLGFSRASPLVALEAFEPRDLHGRPALATAVNERLSEAYGKALVIVRTQHRALVPLARALERGGRLDPGAIARALGIRPAPRRRQRR